MGWALGVSALLHVGLLLLYPRVFGALPESNVQDQPDGPRIIDGMEVIDLIATDTEPLEPEAEPTPARPAEPAAEPPRPTEVLPPADVDPTPGRGEADENEDEDEFSDLTAAERVQPRTRDTRLWQPIPEEYTALSQEQRIENLLYGRLQAMNDSSRVAAERARRATDWTYTDGDGQRWGVSPGKLHLGPITLPMPGFGLPPGASDDLRRAYDQDAEIRRAAGQSGVDETLEERNEAIRIRIEALRKRARADTSKTSGIRRP
jgi:hypothetical protein